MGNSFLFPRVRVPLPGCVTVLSRLTRDAPLAAVALACSAHRTDLYPDRAFNGERQGEPLRKHDKVS
jgi:hypothetical protein